MDILAENAAPVIFEGRSFCFTGRARVKRSRLAEAVTSRGGTVHRGVMRSTDYLVVGGGGSSSWAYGSFGNKILRARYIRYMGGKVNIVQEEAFWEAIGSAA